MEIICINCLFFFLILYTSAVQRCRTDCCACSGFLYISAFLQVPFVHQTSPLSCHCLHASHKFSVDMHWWTLVAKKTMQSCVSGHFHFTHVAPQGSSITRVNGPSHLELSTSLSPHCSTGNGIMNTAALMICSQIVSARLGHVHVSD